MARKGTCRECGNAHYHRMTCSLRTRGVSYGGPDVLPSDCGVQSSWTADTSSYGSGSDSSSGGDGE